MKETFNSKQPKPKTRGMTNETYDSSTDTLLHIKRVNELLLRFAKDLMYRAICHDNSKLREPEKSAFDTFTPKLKGCTYGSEEYKQYLSDLKPALDNHYKRNSHHPEHYDNGIDGMDLLDIVEMFMDWKAAGERHADGSIVKSIEHNKGRFNISEQLVSIFKNTVRNYGWRNEPICIQTGIRCGYPCCSDCRLLNSEQNPDECDATKLNQGTEAGKQITPHSKTIND